MTWVQVLNYQGIDCLGSCLESIREMVQPAGEVRVVVVDNASTDGSGDLVRRNFPDVELLPSDRNRGFTGGNNIGLRKALEERADYAVLVNMDARVDRSCVAELVAVAEEMPQTALVGATICDETGNILEFDGRQFDQVLTAGGYADAPREESGQERIRDAAYACGAGMLVRLEALKEVGLFTEEFFAYHEDVELSLRVRLFGYQVVVATKALVFHARGGAGAGDQFRDFLGARNMFLALLKLYDRPTWLRNAEQLADHFLSGAFPQRSQVLLAALFEAPTILRQRRRLRAEARSAFHELLEKLPSIE